MALLVSYLAGVLPLIQLVVSILLVGAVLLQTRGAGLGAFADSQATTHYKRRGGELFLFRATIALGVVFAVLSFFALFLK